MDLDVLLSRSAALEQSLYKCFSVPVYDSSPRLVASKTLSALAFEHSQAIKHLIAAGLYTSAAALLRVQYESLVRSLWVLYVASDSQAELIISDLTYDSAKKGSTIPMLSQMLVAIEEKAPHAPIEMLKEFKHYSWKPLSSYVHGGIHAVNRFSRGFPAPLVHAMVIHSNGLLTIAANLGLIVSGAPPTDQIPKIQREFGDCLPLPTVPRPAATEPSH